MIIPIEGLPDHVVGFEAVGQVTADDYADSLDPAVRSATQAHEKIRMLYVLGEQFEGYAAGAMWEDTKLGLTNWTNFDRIAFVTDHTGYRDAVKAFGWMIPGEVRTFALDEKDEAVEWITGN